MNKLNEGRKRQSVLTDAKKGKKKKEKKKR